MTRYLKGKEANEVDKSFDSDLSIIEARVFVPMPFFEIAQALQELNKSMEFSMLGKGMWTRQGFFVLKDYYVPEQEVDSTSVDFIEDTGALRAKDGWNVILHSHPFSYGGSDFSSSDETTINSHFDCSLLLTKEGIVKGNLRVPLNGDTHLKVPLAKEQIEFLHATIVPVGGDKIKVKKYKPVNYYKDWKQKKKIEKDFDDAYDRSFGYYDCM